MSKKVGRTIGEVNVDCTLRERHGHTSRTNEISDIRASFQTASSASGEDC
jgi:hypothetical protein